MHIHSLNEHKLMIIKKKYAADNLELVLNEGISQQTQFVSLLIDAEAHQ